MIKALGDVAEKGRRFGVSPTSFRALQTVGHCNGFVGYEIGILKFHLENSKDFICFLDLNQC